MPSAEGGDVTVEERHDHVVTLTLRRPPDNFFDAGLLSEIADRLEALGAGPCRAVVLCAEGRNFCAGASFAGGNHERPVTLYAAAGRIFRAHLPLVAAVQGAAVGGGLGLALAADFRVGTANSRFSANFARLGIHHGFGLSETLPRTVGSQRALELLLTGRRVGGTEAHEIGLIDVLAPEDGLLDSAHALALEIARSAPIAVRAIRETMLAERNRAAVAAMRREQVKQLRLFSSRDFREGVAAMQERRLPDFRGS